ncbi:MAG TPA: glycosyltransferase family 39 protein [Blastocatellia bacterium]|nr:glycosyltransferase family 39 protein [Blastocatellia bacterium]
MTRRPIAASLLFAAVLGGFLLVATVRLADVPVYETDESYTLQVSYEMLTRGRLALPMYRFLGGNITETWHSLTPLFFLLLTGFLKLFGFGVLEGRAFNLITVALAFLMVYVIGRRLFDWPAGLAAVVLMASDQTVLERARLLRNDYAAECFALLAFWLYDVAERRKQPRFYVGAGLAAGAGVMCHSSILYMIAAIALLMLMRDGWRLFKQSKLYLFLASALAVMSYEIISILLDWRNAQAQYRSDDLHFGMFSLSGLWANLLDEPRRYARWYAAYDVYFANVPRTLLHLFQLLIVAAMVYLLVRLVFAIKRRRVSDEPRVRLLVVALTSALFFAVITHKAGYYNVHLITWYALAVGVLLNDAVKTAFDTLRARWPDSLAVRAIAFGLMAIALLGYGALWARQTVRYLREVRNPELARFDEMKAALRRIIPEDLCPIAVKAPVMWLVFVEKDDCFATIERRMADAVDLDGKDYALIVRPKSPDYWARVLDEDGHLLGELQDTPYGNFRVYYTGNDPRFLTRAPVRYSFFRRWRGHATSEQVAAARQVWNQRYDSATELGLMIAPPDKDASVAITDALVLKPNTIYQLQLEAASNTDWQLVVADAQSNVELAQVEIGGGTIERPAEQVFRTFGNRVRLLARPLRAKRAEPLRLIRATINEVAPVGE